MLPVLTARRTAAQWMLETRQNVPKDNYADCLTMPTRVMYGQGATVPTSIAWAVRRLERSAKLQCQTRCRRMLVQGTSELHLGQRSRSSPAFDQSGSEPGARESRQSWQAFLETKSTAACASLVLLVCQLRPRRGRPRRADYRQRVCSVSRFSGVPCSARRASVYLSPVCAILRRTAFLQARSSVTRSPIRPRPCTRRCAAGQHGRTIDATTRRSRRFLHPSE